MSYTNKITILRNVTVRSFVPYEIFRKILEFCNNLRVQTLDPRPDSRTSSDGAVHDLLGRDTAVSGKSAVPFGLQGCRRKRRNAS
jgi:hypothetical protein